METPPWAGRGEPACSQGRRGQRSLGAGAEAGGRVAGRVGARTELRPDDGLCEHPACRWRLPAPVGVSPSATGAGEDNDIDHNKN
jgi:hypothetical protein